MGHKEGNLTLDSLVTSSPGVNRSAVRESEDNYRVLFSKSMQPMLIYDVETLAFLDVNDAAVRHYGYSREEFLRMTIKEIRPPEDVPALLNIISSPQRVEHSVKRKHRRKDGSIIFVDVSSYPITFNDKPARIVLINDVTEHIAAEEALKAERDFVSAVVDTMGGLIVVLDREGGIVRFNRACEQLTGYTFAEVKGRPFWELFLIPEEVETVRATFADLRAGNFPNQHENYWLTKDDTRRLIAWSNTAIVGLDGRPEFIIGTGIDITERKEYEHALRESEARYRLIVDTTQEGICLLDAQATITYVNQRMAEMLGYSAEEMVGRSFFEFMDDAARKEAEAYYQRRREGVWEQHDFRFLRKDGSSVWTIVSANPIYNHQGEFIGSLKMITDITERKRAEEALIESEKRAIVDYERLLDRLDSLSQTFGMARDLESIFRAVRDFAIASTPCIGILISLYHHERNERTAVYAWREGAELDLSAQPIPMTDDIHSRAAKTGKVVITDSYWNASAAQTVADFKFGEDKRSPRASLIAPMNFMGRTLGAIEVHSTTPSAFHIEHASAMRMAANLAAVAIENVRLLKHELERAEQEAEIEKMRSLGQLAAGVAHDFNNSLAAILGRTQLLKRTVINEKQRYDLEVIERASLDAAETVRRIQTFARRSPGEKATDVSISKLINDAIQLTRTRWEDDALARGLRYDIQFTPDYEGPDHISANPSEVREVFVNLIFNALDAMPAGGKIDIRERSENGFVCIEFKDTGEGMPPELYDRIFEPFFTTKGPQGSGLGLAVSYGIIQRHAGAVDVKSELGQGTVFTIRFPLASGAPAPVPRKKRTRLPARRVLVVDDEEVVREVIAEMLGELKQQVTHVASGPEALNALASNSFDLMITDLSMPAMDGLTLASEAHKRAPEMLIALTTGYGQTIPGGTPDPNIVNSIISKPFQESDLESLLLSLYTSSKRTKIVDRES